MQREYSCPSCGATIDAWRGWKSCPRCYNPLPSHYLDAAGLPPGTEEAGRMHPADLLTPRPDPLLSGTDFRIGEPGWQPPGEGGGAAGGLAGAGKGAGGLHWWVGAGTFLLVLLLALAAWTLLDTDRDGLSAWRELSAGTDPVRGDSDGDGLADGWETSHGLDPLEADSDGDRLDDGWELREGADPRSPDSDGDGLADVLEAGLVVTDCDGDGVPGVAEGDGDDDGRLDALEGPSDRCRRDADGDGVPDGGEGSEACVHSADCDGDGLDDPQEAGAAGRGFDPLNPDSFGVGLSDAVSWAFADAGQPPSRDDDRDGIPDAWESSTGLIDWDGLGPEAGRPDLLIEYLRVVGPDSDRYLDDLDFAPAYEAVAQAFLDGAGVRVGWVETLVEEEDEPRPPLVPSGDTAYYARVLAAGRHSANPYVTTVVLNPQLDQRAGLHAGIAPIRGMLASVDYGQHALVHFRSDAADLTLRPVLESLAAAGDEEAIAALGFDRGGLTTEGEVAFRSDDGGWWLAWEPWWFSSRPTYHFDDGTTLSLGRAGAEPENAELAHTLLHELGHTLGLCHAHEAECYAAFSPQDRADRDLSAMSYDSDPESLLFLPSEWSTALTYLACPPAQPLALLAEGAGEPEVLDAKYAYRGLDLTDIGSRACGDFAAVEREFAPGEPAAATYLPPPSDLHPQTSSDSPAGALLYAGGALLVALLAGVALLMHLRRRPAWDRFWGTHHDQP